MLNQGFLGRGLLVRTPCLTVSELFFHVCTSLPQLPINHPLSLLRSDTPSFTHFFFVQKCSIYPMLPDCLWNFHAYVNFPCTTRIIYSSSQPMGRNPFGSQTTLSQESPKYILHSRYLHYDS
uniref:Uncharacterized protein n=1 Tax=Myotis myotis TaxID=51298 RepID=A0A7J7WVW5_MYOMY|nr:hypothetical protein mMyoMyo1_011894 [Myotis myotis]